MTSISWNDLNDSSQMSAASSDEAPPKKDEPKEKNQSVTTLQKTLSSPDPSLKSNKNMDKQRIEQNLQKLQRHRGQNVWLYVIANSTRQQQCEKILNNMNVFQKIVVTGKALNVLAKSESAAEYIEKGHYEKGINLKFIYSNKNDNQQTGKKVQKKYSEKYSEKSQNQQIEEIKSPRAKTKYSNYEKSNSFKEGEKKKVKYVLKDEPVKKQQVIPKSLEQIQQHSEPSNNQVSRTQSKQQKCSIDTNQQKQIIKEVKEVKEEQNNQENQEVELKQEERKQQKKEVEVEVEPEEEDKQKFKKKQSELSDREQQKEVKQKKKKSTNRKKNKGKSGGGSSNFDPNNRFSELF